ncbi:MULTISPECIES: YlbF family regulator [unclassified Staphylococcus]|uniref:YlbF family regulator n=1 Tax=unclassified Staphylococcus TaxID=91994 RepID=UPI0021D24F61|nr:MULTISPECIES: YlbF family regulator [unclassified Staphylococcus]UXR77480.1 YlbF family regulator [Staphylococcus sp. IVB6227]UXR83378.1 YlbF family regulator [Staphylococcus sp. IVB6214]
MTNKEDVLRKARELQQSIQDLETIQYYKQVETQIHQNEHIAKQMKTLKQQQKQSVNLQNYDKPIAYQRSEATIQAIQAEIDDMPIVSEFRQAQREANDTIQFIIETLADGIDISQLDSQQDDE